MKLLRTLKIKSKQGLHTRPATAIVKALQNSNSVVYFIHKKNRVNAKSILSLLMLAAGKNSEITIEVEGEDADMVMKQMVDVFENQLGENPCY